MECKRGFSLSSYNWVLVIMKGVKNEDQETKTKKKMANSYYSCNDIM